MTVRKTTRRGKPRLVIDIPYTDARTGRPARYRRDAEVQTTVAARAEEQRLVATLVRLGYIPDRNEPPAAPAAAPPCGAPSEAFTFDDAVRLFRETKALTALKATTRRGYDVSLDAHLAPRFGKGPLEAVDHTAVMRLDAELVGAGLTPRSRANVQIALRSVLGCAVDAKKLARMPDLPELPKARRKAVRPPSPDEVDRVLAVAYPSARLALLLAADAGLRAGEVRGLRWCDVDLEAGSLYVRQTVYRGATDTPKSGHEREVPLTSRLALALAAEHASRSPAPEAPVSLSTRGAVWGESSLRTAFRLSLARAGLPPARLHDLRHFFVTQCFRAGGDAPTVQALAGHQHLSVTQRYAHTGAEQKRAVVDRLAAARSGNLAVTAARAG
jgi:integrase